MHPCRYGRDSAEERKEVMERYREWVERYISAWNSNDPTEIAALFAPRAEYFTEPFAEPWRGVDGIVRSWLGRKDEPGDSTFRYRVLTATPDLGIVRGLTFYESQSTEYHNLWEITLDEEERCTRFVEWWMQQKR